MEHVTYITFDLRKQKWKKTALQYIYIYKIKQKNKSHSCSKTDFDPKWLATNPLPETS
jgi:hypothetical protein